VAFESSCARFDCEYDGSFDRLNVDDRARFSLLFGSGGLLLGLHHVFRHHAFQEESDGAFAFGGFAYFGAWSEDA
jgi:hypothetical protein